MLAGLRSTDAAVRLFRGLRNRLDSLDAAEIFYRDGLELVCARARLEDPFATPHPVYVLVECASRHDPLDELAEALDTAPEVVDVVVAADARDRAALWAYRDSHSEAVRASGVPHKLDVALPLAAIATFERLVRDRVARLSPEARTILWGHLGDGNLHVNVLGFEPYDDRVDEAVLLLVAELGGSIGAEHGIGIAKTRWLSLTRSPEELAAMREVKRAFDPQGILNPGVLLGT